MRADERAHAANLNGMGDTVRAFIALRPPAAWTEAFASWQATLRSELPDPGIRWVRPEHIHVTLRFLGAIRAEEASAVAARITRATSLCAPFVLKAGRLGCFPSPRRPRVLWAGLEGEVQAVVALQRRVAEETAEIGEPLEDRAFTPHLTLARIKELSGRTQEIVERSLSVPVEVRQPWPVSEVLLMRSHLGAGGAEYEVLSTSRLSGIKKEPDGA